MLRGSCLPRSLRSSQIRLGTVFGTYTLTRWAPAAYLGLKSHGMTTASKSTLGVETSTSRTISGLDTAEPQGSTTTKNANSKLKIVDKNHVKTIPTHFLALPLVTATSLPQLASSLSHFQSLTTAPRTLRPSELRALEKRREQETHERDAGEDSTNASEISGQEANKTSERIKIIPAAAHRPPGTLHLTLGVMTLGDAVATERALSFLKGIDYLQLLQEADGRQADYSNRQLAELGEERQQRLSNSTHEATTAASDVANTAPKTLTTEITPPLSSTSPALEEAHPAALHISLRSLQTFPSNNCARVFYAEPYDPTARLQSFAESIRRKFVGAGIISKENRELTLHATLANLKYVRGPSLKGKRQRNNADATDVIHVFAEQEGKLQITRDDRGEEKNSEQRPFVWAQDILINRVRICKMGAVKSDNEIMGMEYPAIVVATSGGEKEVAEAVFG